MAEESSSQIAENTQTFQIIQNAPPSQSTKNTPGNVSTAWFLIGLILLAGAVRSLGLNRPLLGNFAAKNVALAMIARNWAEGRSPWYYPRVDVLVEGQRGLHLLELPIGAYLAGALWRAGGGSLDLWGRACSVAFYTAATAIFFLWVQTRWGPLPARAAALMLALSPVGVIYGQCFMLDASLVFFTVAGLASLDQYLCRGGWVWWSLAAANLALLVVTKPYLAVWLIPAGWLIYTSQADRVRKIGGWLALGAALAPAAGWYLHVMQAASPQNPLARHVFDSLRKSMVVYQPPDPLLASPQFYRQVLDDLAGPVLTPIGFGLMLLGLVQGGLRRWGIWLLPPAILLLAMPRKFFEMNYYWTATLPAWCLLAGQGWRRLAEGLPMGRAAKVVCWLVVGVFALRYAAKPAFITPAEDRPVLEAASAAQELADPEEPVVTMHGSTIDLLYYCRRPGWAFRPDDPQLADRLRQCQTAGARWVVVVGRDGLAEQLGPRRPPVHQETAHYRIYRLAEWQPTP